MKEFHTEDLQIISRHRSKPSRPGDLAPQIRVPLPFTVYFESIVV